MDVIACKTVISRLLKCAFGSTSAMAIAIANRPHVHRDEEKDDTSQLQKPQVTVLCCAWYCSETAQGKEKQHEYYISSASISVAGVFPHEFSRSTKSQTNPRCMAVGTKTQHSTGFYLHKIETFCMFVIIFCNLLSVLTIKIEQNDSNLMVWKKVCGLLIHFTSPLAFFEFFLNTGGFFFHCKSFAVHGSESDAVYVQLSSAATTVRKCSNLWGCGYWHLAEHKNPGKNVACCSLPTDTTKHQPEHIKRTG